jgi:hypothetical protein
LKALPPQIGSTEWVEDNLEDLHCKVVAYLNVDCSVQGVGFFFSGSTPQLDKLLVVMEFRFLQEGVCLFPDIVDLSRTFSKVCLNYHK